MQSQLERIAAGDWRLMVIMDAARYDAVRTIWPETECVESPGFATREWLEAVLPTLAALTPLTYVSANPRADATLSALDAPFPIVPLWQSLWGWHGPARIPHVHPYAFAGAVKALLDEGYLPAEGRLVVHFLTPHHPYLADTEAKGTTHWGREAMAERCAFHDCLDWRYEAQEGWRAAQIWPLYMKNVEFTCDAVDNLLSWAALPAVVTADHGECFGEDGLIGHAIDHPVLRRIPWRAVPDPLKPSTGILRKLEALGYA